jgi:hypothetical protein
MIRTNIQQKVRYQLEVIEFLERELIKEEHESHTFVESSRSFCLENLFKAIRSTGIERVVLRLALKADFNDIKGLANQQLGYTRGASTKELGWRY